MWLTRISLKHPVAVTLFYLAVAIIGGVAAMTLGKSVLPEIAIPTIAVSANYPGAGSLEMERLIVEPIEDAVSGVAGVERVSASAQSGAAQVIVQFRFGSPLQTAQSDVQTAIDGARANMPADLLPPIVSRADPSQRPVIELAVSSATMDRRALAILLDRNIVPALRGTSGVGSVRVSGEPNRTFFIEPKPAQMNALALTDLDLLRTAVGAATVYPAGNLRIDAADVSAGVQSDATNPNALALRTVDATNANVALGDVANVRDGAAEPTTLSSIDGDDAMLLYIARAPDADAGAMIDAVRRTVQKLRDRFPLARVVEYHSDQPFTDAAIAGVVQTMLEGIAITMLTMLLFLRSSKRALVAALAIPTSLLASLVAMRAFGYSLNILSLMGLSLTVGILVDDSIVIIEAITHAFEKGKRGDDAALAGRSELGGAAIAITFVDIAVFLPIAMMGGLVGEFMREYAAVIVIATAFSLLVSLTLTPLVCARWGIVSRRAGKLPWTLRTRWFQALVVTVRAFAARFVDFEQAIATGYASKWLPWALRKKRLVITCVAFTALASCVPLGTGAISQEFSPPAARGEVLIDLAYPAGTPLTTTDAGSRAFAARLLDRDDELADVVTTAGRAFDGTTDVIAGNLAEIGIELRDQSAPSLATAKLAKALGNAVPGAAILQGGLGMGGLAPIAFQVAGDEQQLSIGASKIAELLLANPFADDVRRSDVGVTNHIEFRVDEVRARLLGVNPDDVAQTARIATGGALGTRTRTPDGLVDIVVRDPRARAGDLAAMRSAMVRSTNGTLIPLAALIETESAFEPVVIEREDRARVVTVTANPRDGAPLGKAAAPVAARIGSVLPPGTYIRARGDLEQFLATVGAMLEALGLSVLLAYAVLAILYRSYVLPLVVMTSVPLASIGAFGALALAHQPLNLYSMLGIIMLVGLVAKNGILLVEFAERAVRNGVDAREAVQAAAMRRFRPIMMTTVAMVGGMLPLALGHAVGAEYRQALGTVVIGGLLSSLLLTFFVVPIFFVMMHGKEKGAAIATPLPLSS